MRCDEVESLLMRYVDGRLPPARAESVDTHLDVCPRCRRTYAEEVELVAAFHADGLHPAGDALVQDVMRQVQTLPGGAGSGAHTVVRIRSGAVAALAAAAAVALVLVWQSGAAWWAGWTTSGAVGEAAVRLSGWQHATAAAAATLGSAVDETSRWVRRLVGAGEAVVGTVSHEHHLLIGALTAAAAVACVWLVGAFRNRLSKEMR